MEHTETIDIPITPLEEAKHLSSYLGGPRIYFKRDDLTGLGLGGNKVRKLKYLFEDAQAQGANVIISTASIHSNYLRILASGCRKMGWDCRLFVRGTPPVQVTGNYLCYHLMQPRIMFVPTDDPFDDRILELMEDTAQEERRRGNVPYLIHLATFSAPLAILGYYYAYKEILEQGGDFDHIFVACGSGGTYGGLLLGVMLNDGSSQVHGVSVMLPSETLKELVLAGLKGATKLLGRELPALFPQELDIRSDFVGTAYSQPPKASLQAVHLVARTEGILLDPIYTGRSFAALLHTIQMGTIRSNERVLFVHTGGIPNLFAHASALQTLLKKGATS